jgi:hypothetical protein
MINLISSSVKVAPSTKTLLSRAEVIKAHKLKALIKALIKAIKLVEDAACVAATSFN